MRSHLESTDTEGSSLPQRLGTFCPRTALPIGTSRARSLQAGRQLWSAALEAWGSSCLMTLGVLENSILHSSLPGSSNQVGV